MSLKELFQECIGDGWTTAGKDVQYKVVDRVLYFQCSNGKSDWRYNFKAWGDVYKSSDIEFIGHKGFNELWESVRHEIEALAFDKIVGYSQGGALAVRAHENYLHRFGWQPMTYVFGCPPSIYAPSPELRKRFTHVVNIHNANDIVHAAPQVLGYSHIGIDHRLSLKGVKRAGDWTLLQWLSGHTPDQYIQALDQC